MILIMKFPDRRPLRDAFRFPFLLSALRIIYKRVARFRLATNLFPIHDGIVYSTTNVYIGYNAWARAESLLLFLAEAINECFFDNGISCTRYWSAYRNSVYNIYALLRVPRRVYSRRQLRNDCLKRIRLNFFSSFFFFLFYS